MGSRQIVGRVTRRGVTKFGGAGPPPPVNPFTIFGVGNVDQWVRADLGIVQVANAISQWGDQTAGALHYTQPAANKPIFVPNDTTLAGLPTVQFAQAGNLALTSTMFRPLPATTPTCVLAVHKTLLPGGNRQLYVSAGNFFYSRVTAIATLDSLNGGTISVPHAPNTWVRYRADYSNNAADILRSGANVVTGNAGNNAGIGGQSIGGAAAPDAWVWELIYLRIIPSVAQFNAYDAYVTSLTSGLVAL